MIIEQAQNRQPSVAPFSEPAQLTIIAFAEKLIEEKADDQVLALIKRLVTGGALPINLSRCLN